VCGIMGGVEGCSCAWARARCRSHGRRNGRAEQTLGRRTCVSGRNKNGRGAGGRAAPEATRRRAAGGRLHLLGVGRLRELGLLDAQYGRAHLLQLRDHLLVVHLEGGRDV